MFGFYLNIGWCRVGRRARQSFTRSLTATHRSGPFYIPKSWGYLRERGILALYDSAHRISIYLLFDLAGRRWDVMSSNWSESRHKIAVIIEWVARVHRWWACLFIVCVCVCLSFAGWTVLDGAMRNANTRRPTVPLGNKFAGLINLSNGLGWPWPSFVPSSPPSSVQLDWVIVRVPSPEGILSEGRRSCRRYPTAFSQSSESAPFQLLDRYFERHSQQIHHHQQHYALLRTEKGSHFTSASTSIG